jgi:hypothetical protein
MLTGASRSFHLGASSGKPPIMSTPANSMIGQELAQMLGGAPHQRFSGC